MVEEFLYVVVERNDLAKILLRQDKGFCGGENPSKDLVIILPK